MMSIPNDFSRSNANVRYLESEMMGDETFTYIPLLEEIISESQYHEYSLSYYDPFVGNLCAAGMFVGVPVIAAPHGPRGADLAISLIQHKPKQQPPYNILAPRSALASFPSPICQIATPAPQIQASELDEQILVRTMESVTIFAASPNVPRAISRMESSFVDIIAQIPATPPQCTDVTIHAAISPFSPNIYALIGDRGRVALWTRPMVSSSMSSHTDEDDSDNGDGAHRRQHSKGFRRRISQDFSGASLQIETSKFSASAGTSEVLVVRKEDAKRNDDPWRTCTWGVHPNQLIVASRGSMDLVDLRTKAVQTCLFEPRNRETIRAIQEDAKLLLAPFQTYIATSHQIACIDQRFAKRPVMSWAHQMDRYMPCGIKAMDLISNGGKYSTVLIWNERDADIVAYNVSLGSDERGPEPMIMQGRAQELPSFHSHTQYTNSSSLRDPQKRAQFTYRPNHQLQQATKPPLRGLAVLPDSILAEKDEEDDQLVDHDVSAMGKKSVSRFSLVQYAYTGAVYAQEIVLRTKQEIEAAGSDVPKDSILGTNLNQDSAPDIDSANTTSFKLVQDLIANQFEEDEIVKALLEAPKGNTMVRKQKDEEAQKLADDEKFEAPEVHLHRNADQRPLLKKLKELLLVDPEVQDNRDDRDIEAMVDKAMDFIGSMASPNSMLKIMHAIGCDRWSTDERSRIAQLVEENIELEPFATTDKGEIVQRRIQRTWPILGGKVNELLRGTALTLQTLTEFLADMYPLPEGRALGPEQGSDGPSLTSLLENLSIPSNQISLELMDAMQDLEQEHQRGVIWPTQESRMIRSNTIRRLAQELLLSGIVVVQSIEPYTTNGQEATSSAQEYPTFQYLFQSAKKPPKVILSKVCKEILSDWNVGEDVTKYAYRLPERMTNLVRQESDAEDVDEEEIKERNERLLELRRKREQREIKILAARKNDHGYNTSAGGSASQPAGIVTSMFDSSPFGEADDDGMFSMPTVISASQPVSNVRAGLTPQRTKPKVVPPMKPVFSASQPNMVSATTERMPHPHGVRPMPSHDISFQSVSFAQSEDWEATLSMEDRTQAVSWSQDFGTDLSQSESVGLSQDAGGAMWSASQPVRGNFANRKVVAGSGSGQAKKKKKPRSQGF
ncbi:hypothetical protein BGZ54_003559 [Gamsiella multidivaricata]|nr:hypothetical protein BGZ54_003559 [Gamsiella multidivaricata]